MKTLVECQDKEHADKKYKPKMSQVPFVAICTRGHLDDFPLTSGYTVPLTRRVQARYASCRAEAAGSKGRS
jgi:hypothetical protein